MCKCTPNIRTPYCGKLGCEWPRQRGPNRSLLKVDDRSLGFMLSGNAEFNVKVESEVPDGAVLQSIHHEAATRSFVYVFAHESFPVTNVGELLPQLPSPIVEVTEKKSLPVTVEWCEERWDDTASVNGVREYKVFDSIRIVFTAFLGGWTAPALVVGSTIIVNPTTDRIEAICGALAVE